MTKEDQKLLQKQRSLARIAKSTSINGRSVFVNEKGKQVISDNWAIIFRLNHHLPLEECHPVSLLTSTDVREFRAKIEGVVNSAGWNALALPAPKIDEIKEYIAKAPRVKDDRDRRKKISVWDFGKGKPAVDAKLLLDILTAFPDATLRIDEEKPVRKPIYIHSVDGDGILMPYLTFEKRLEA